MKISVVTICYNSAELIDDAIKSVLSQDYPDLEYIIVDGNSTDNTMEIVRGYGDKIHTVVSEPDKGLYDAINKGVDLATGDVVGFLHSDDYFTGTGVISSIAKAFKEQDVDATYSDLRYVDRENTDRLIRDWKTGLYTKGGFRRGWSAPHETFYLKKSCYEKYGNYRLDFEISSDYELMLRMIHKHEISLAYIREVLVVMRVGGKSNVSLQNRLLANKEDRRAWTVNGLKPAWYTRYMKPLRKLKHYKLFG